MLTKLRRLIKWPVLGVLGLLIVTLGSDVRHLNVAQRVASPYLFNLAEWEVDNFLGKWVHRLASSAPWSSSSGEDAYEKVREYFRLGEEVGRLGRDLGAAAADGRDAASLEVELVGLRDERDGLRSDVEETIEGTISFVVVDEGLSTFREFIFPPVDIRLSDLPKLLIASPRDKIERKHDVLLRSGIKLGEREEIEDRLFSESDLSALVEDIGGLATYPASIPTNQPLRWTMQISTHEWLHHYLFFRPLGQNMFNGDDMVTLNETVASIAGNEIGDRAYELLGGVIEPDPVDGEGDSYEADANVENEEEFDFDAEMRKTRTRVDQLLEEGKIEEAELYMERRRRMFVENGFHIRKLNQAYFAFYGTYADTPASVSPIGGQLERFRSLMPDVGAFVSAMADFSSYDRFLEALEALEANTPSSP
ncbi:MAG: hypothetical protein IH861_16375 [Chloroflexi bacterium]|nr:hypothetical protein [Chloroflexota bacterium]